jgi:hypothetical protein
MKIARVFPRKTEQTPDDALVFFTEPPRYGYEKVYESLDEIHISCTFTYDCKTAEWLCKQWESLGIPVKIGGPAYDNYTKEFIPGMYLKRGCTITSVGCHNKCWFCSVWKRAGDLKELEIKDGWIIQDDNFLLCSENHKKAVIEMLKKQKHRPEFRGGLEAKLLTRADVELIQSANPKSMYFAYDTPDDYEPLIEAGKLLQEAGITLKTRIPYAYVLMGYPKDTMQAAEQRCIDTLKAGFIPFGMLYKDKDGNENKAWRRFSRNWARMEIVYSRNKEFFTAGMEQEGYMEGHK